MGIPPSITLLLFAISGAITFGMLSKKSSKDNKSYKNLSWKDLNSVSETMPVITYKEAMEYFVIERPNDQRIKKGALLLRKKKDFWGKYYDFAQVFLDENSEIVLRSNQKPYGRHFKAKDIDKELQEAFGEHDLIIVE